MPQRPDPASQVLLDHVQAYLANGFGPDEKIRKVLIRVSPFRLVVVTDQSTRLVLECRAKPSCN